MPVQRRKHAQASSGAPCGLLNEAHNVGREKSGEVAERIDEGNARSGGNSTQQQRSACPRKPGS